MVSVIYEEVDQIESPDQLAEYGINLIEPEIDDAFTAAQLQGGTSLLGQSLLPDGKTSWGYLHLK